MADVYVSTRWRPKSGREDEFVSQWRDAMEWTKNNFAELERARLLRNQDDPGRFITFIEWDNGAAVERWMKDPEKQRRQVALEELCDEAEGFVYHEAARVG